MGMGAFSMHKDSICPMVTELTQRGFGGGS